MGLFTRGPKVAADGFERKSVRGYAHKGKVASMLAEGWEIEHSTAVQVGGNTWGKQMMFVLRRRV